MLGLDLEQNNEADIRRPIFKIKNAGYTLTQDKKSDDSNSFNGD